MVNIFDYFRSTYVPPNPRSGTETVTGRQLLIHPQMLGDNGGDNVNVPSLIRVPDWAARPLGKYYLYFASHSDSRHIHLAVSDRVEGPWRIHSPSELAASEVPEIGDHVAAPDVHIDHARRQIRLYFHAHSKRRNRTGAMLALSQNGVDFLAQPELLGSFYFRAFKYEDRWYGVSKGGRLWLSENNGLSAFTRGPDLFSRVPRNTRRYNVRGSVRHVSIEVTNTHADIFFTRIGDTPERVLKSRVDLDQHWRNWRAAPPEEVIEPLESWEGADLDILPSTMGAAREPVHQLRDPYIFTDDDGERFLLYAVAGERGIAIARLRSD